ncbi:MAG: aldo/keto reductase [Candidatus Sericytochromatia bacterium]|nr:aldo/keto reductase [Candidatus Sericytochromatia bacterium]
MSVSPPSVSPYIVLRGQTLPAFFYGTAWKEERTERCVSAALQAGFRAIDTANQRKHYFEAGVGAALQAAYAAGSLTRQDLFLQTKFTFLVGQDQRLPYDPEADFATQVSQSFASSLDHLGTDYLDSYVLHGPSSGQGLTATDWEVWRAMEALQKSGQVKFLGVSNINVWQLQALLEGAEVPPAIVQNRCYARTQWDAAVRAVCARNDMRYQGFSLLTANVRELNHPLMQSLGVKYGVSWMQLVFRFALQLGMLPLTGTTDPGHMAQDLAVFQFELSQEEVGLIETIAL